MTEVPDLSQLRRQARPVLTQQDRMMGEVQAGLRCQGCGRRITPQLGMRAWVIMEPATGPDGTSGWGIGNPMTCGDTECSAYVELSRIAVAMREVQGWTFLDEARVRSEA